jgi:hypothetical protein
MRRLVFVQEVLSSPDQKAMYLTENWVNTRTFVPT